MKIFILAFLTAITLPCYGQETPEQFHFGPQKPTVNSSIGFQYDSRPIFKNNDNITCIVYFTGLNDRTLQRNTFPIAKIIPLRKTGEIWAGKIDSIPQRTSALVFAFIDSLGHRDTNHGKGYYTPIYENNKTVPGAWAGIGDLLFGNYITNYAKYHIQYELDSLRKYFMKDFVLYPDVKRQYFRQYLGTFKLDNKADEDNYKMELEEIARYRDVTHHELTTITFEYRRLKDTVNANKYERQNFEKFPNGSWTVQSKSLKLSRDIGMTHDFEKQIKIYRQFKETYLKPYEEEFATKAMNISAGQMLGYMLEHFVKDGTLEVWLNEVGGLTDDGKRIAYQVASRELLGMGRPKPTQPNNNNSSTIEHPFLLNTMEGPDRKAKIAEDLSIRAVDISKDNFENPRNYIKSMILTDAEVKDRMNLLMSMSLNILGISLMKQNKFDEAVKIMTEAIHRNHYQESTINQTYIESLVKAGKIDLALSEIEKIVGMGKSTTVIDSFYAKYKKKDNNLTGYKDQSLAKAKEMVKQKLILENAPDFSYYDVNGKEVKLSSIKNKIIVIDVWASWCPPCMITLKAIDQVIDKYKQDPDVVFLLVGEDESKSRAQKTINEHRNKSAFVFDIKQSFIKKYAANLPSQMIIDKKGKLRFRTMGLTSFNIQEIAIELEAMIETIKE